MRERQEQARHVVAVVGGAIAGSAAAEILADQGILVVVLEQNDRPYGKIEDGLPRWHHKQRPMEYRRIDSRLDRLGVRFVPRTRLGTDISFDELTQEWGLSGVVLANGAWRDRALRVEGVDRFVDRGLVYQNPFIYWFNHKNEKGYAGPRYEIPEGTIVVGGGLASIDVIKVVQLELYERSLRKQGIEVDMYTLEHKGIPAVCEAHGIDAGELGVRDGILFYRRRVFDMPLAQAPPNATEKQLQKVEATRKKILDRCQEKYLFAFHDRHLPVEALTEGDRLVGLRFVRTEVDGRRAIPIPGTEVDWRTELVISSIGSVPEVIPGVEMTGEYYRFQDWDTGEYAAREGVFGAGNVVTGQGNIRVSLKHGQAVAHHLVEKYLGIIEQSPRDWSFPPEPERRGQDVAAKVLEALDSRPPLAPEQVEAILERIQRRWAEVGYDGNYKAWIEKVTPPDLE